MLEAKELLESMRKVDSSNIKEIVMQAYNDEKLANTVENQMLLKESKMRERPL